MDIFFCRLLLDPDTRIQEQALTFLRNLACGKEDSDIEKIFEGFGQDLLTHLERAINIKNDELLLQVS
jgi:hypothetical protein